MKVRLIGIGKPGNKPLLRCLRDYEERISRYTSFERIETPDEKGIHDSGVLVQREGDRLLKLVRPESYVVLLDEGGRSMDSSAFAAWLQERMNRSVRRLDFLIGGAYGHGPEVRERADDALSLSPMTFAHDLARLVFVEQLYRAFTILRGEPYHK